MKRWLHGREFPIYFEAPKDKGSGGNTGDDDPGDDGNPEKVESTPSLQELIKDESFKKELDQYNEGWFKERWEREEKKRKREQQKQKETDLQQAEEHQQLAEERGQRIAELEQELEQTTASVKEWQERAKASEKALGSYVDKLKANIDEPTRTLLDRLPAHEQLEWLVANKVEASGGDGDEPPKKVPPSPDPDNQDPAKRKQRKQEARSRSARRYKSTF